MRALFPPSIALSTLDTVVSGHSLSTPFGRAVAYTALYECACFTTCGSTRIYYDSNIESGGLPRNVDDILSTLKLPIPSPTVLFVHPDHLQDLSTAVLSRAKKSFAYPIAWRHKLAALAEGFVSKEGLWDRAVFDGAREYVMGRMAGTLKAVVVSGGECFIFLVLTLTQTEVFQVRYRTMHQRPRGLHSRYRSSMLISMHRQAAPFLLRMPLISSLCLQQRANQLTLVPQV